MRTRRARTRRTVKCVAVAPPTLGVVLASTGGVGPLAGLCAAFTAYALARKVAEAVSGTERTPPPTWQETADALKAAGVRSVGGFEAISLVRNKGFKVVDVRTEDEHAKRRPRGAVPAPVYSGKPATEPLERVRELLLTSAGVRPTRPNLRFVEDVVGGVGDECPGVILVDDAPRTGGGGRAQSRALVAALRLVTSGFETTVVHCEGGVEALYAEGFPQVPRPGVPAEDA